MLQSSFNKLWKAIVIYFYIFQRKIDRIFMFFIFDNQKIDYHSEPPFGHIAKVCLFLLLLYFENKTSKFRVSFQNYRNSMGIRIQTCMRWMWTVNLCKVIKQKEIVSTCLTTLYPDFKFGHRTKSRKRKRKLKINSKNIGIMFHVCSL